jgi:hypothetical protein
MSGRAGRLLPNNILALGAVGAVGAAGLAFREALDRYWLSHSRAKKTRRGTLSFTLAESQPRLSGTSPGMQLRQLYCHVTGHIECDLVEYYTEVGRGHYTIRYEIENCRNVVTDVWCDPDPEPTSGHGGGPHDGGGGASTDPETERIRNCLWKSQRDYETATRNCKNVYTGGTIATVVGGLACTVFLPITALNCALGALGVESGLSAQYAACMLNEANKKKDRDADCLSGIT